MVSTSGCMSKSEVVPESPWGPIYATTEMGTPATSEYRQRAERQSAENHNPEEDSIIADCKKLGWTINSIWDVVMYLSRHIDERLFPILGKHLRRQYSSKVL